MLGTFGCNVSDKSKGAPTDMFAVGVILAQLFTQLDVGLDCLRRSNDEREGGDADRTPLLPRWEGLPESAEADEDAGAAETLRRFLFGSARQALVPDAPRVADGPPRGDHVRHRHRCSLLWSLLEKANSFPGSRAHRCSRPRTHTLTPPTSLGLMAHVVLLARRLRLASRHGWRSRHGWCGGWRSRHGWRHGWQRATGACLRARADQLRSCA